LQGSSKALKISHIGIAVSDIEKSISDYQKLIGFERVEQVEVPSEHVKVAMLTLAESEIELLCPTSEEGAIAKFLRDHGEGIHHIAFDVADVSKAIEDAEKLGFRVVDKKPRRGAWGSVAAFVHPRSAHGVLIEYYAKTKR